MTAQKGTKRTRKTTKQAQAPPVKELEVEIPDVSEVLEQPEVEREVETEVLEQPEVETETNILRSTSRKSSMNGEELELSFDCLIDRLTREFESRKDDKKPTSIKTIRSLVSDIKRLKKDSLKLCRKGKKKTTRTNVESGFLKPVSVSKGMCKFAGWNPEELHSRVDVTKFICNYVKDNNLQNPSDRRQIIPDKKLSKLLSYDSKTEDQPLTYFYLQKKIKDHFI